MSVAPVPTARRWNRNEITRVTPIKSASSGMSYMTIADHHRSLLPCEEIDAYGLSDSISKRKKEKIRSCFTRDKHKDKETAPPNSLSHRLISCFFYSFSLTGLVTVLTFYFLVHVWLHRQTEQRYSRWNWKTIGLHLPQGDVLVTDVGKQLTLLMYIK